jgi:ribosome-associated toxin RatA of RatAB toxin-antitoxin module
MPAKLSFISILNSPMLIEMAFGRIFKELALNMVQAFTARAKEVYRVG